MIITFSKWVDVYPVPSRPKKQWTHVAKVLAKSVGIRLSGEATFKGSGSYRYDLSWQGEGVKSHYCLIQDKHIWSSDEHEEHYGIKGGEKALELVVDIIKRRGLRTTFMFDENEKLAGVEIAEEYLNTIIKRVN